MIQYDQLDALKEKFYLIGLGTAVLSFAVQEQFNALDSWQRNEVLQSMKKGEEDAL